VYLLSGDVLATIAVGLGIIWEHGPPDVQRVANRLVIGGVIVETVCSIWLFAYDENISAEQQSIIRSQNSQIIALETRLAPRLIKDPEGMVKKLKPFPGIPFDIGIQPVDETLGFLDQLIPVLTKAGWVWRPTTRPGTPFNAPGLPKMLDIIMRGGIQIRIAPSRDAEWGPAVTVLGKALGAEGFLVDDRAMDGVTDEVVHINIGTK